MSYLHLSADGHVSSIKDDREFHVARIILIVALFACDYCLFIWVLVEQRGGWSADGAAAFRSCVNMVYWKASCYWEWKHGLTRAVLSSHLCSLFDCSSPSKGL